GPVRLSVDLQRHSLGRRDQFRVGAEQCSNHGRRGLQGGGGKSLGFGDERGGNFDSPCSTGDSDPAAGSSGGGGPERDVFSGGERHDAVELSVAFERHGVGGGHQCC